MAQEGLDPSNAETINGLKDVWNSIGLSEEKQQEELNSLDEKIKKLYQETLENARERKEKCAIDLMNRQMEISVISVHLGEPKPESLFSEETSLLEKLEIVNRFVEDLRKRKEQRVAQLSMLKSQLYECCDQMDTPVETQFIDLLSDITPSRVVAFEDKLKIMSLELENRKAAVKKVIEECAFLLVEIGLTSSSPLDQAILQNGEGLKYSSQVIQEISERAVQLNTIKDERIARVEELGKEINVLWDKLKISQNMRNEFLEGVSGISNEAIGCLTDELARLRQVRKDRLSDLVVEARRAIVTLWDEMQYPHDRREYFDGMMKLQVEEFNEDVLTRHEDEVETLTSRREAIKPFIKYIEKREQIIADRAEYEESLKDPDRLLKVGRDTGRLLREEKLQTRIKKDLPKVTEWLQKKLPIWEEENGTTFFYQGERYLNKMEDVDRAYMEEKEANKVAKEKKKRMERERDITWGSTPRRVGSKDKIKTIKSSKRHGTKPTETTNVCSLSRQAPPLGDLDESMQRRLSLSSSLKSPRSDSS